MNLQLSYFSAFWAYPRLPAYDRSLPCTLLFADILPSSQQLTVLVAITPLQAASSRLFYVYQKKLLAAADARLNLATEVINSVRIVKYFA